MTHAELNIKPGDRVRVTIEGEVGQRGAYRSPADTQVLDIKGFGLLLIEVDWDYRDKTSAEVEVVSRAVPERNEVKPGQTYRSLFWGGYAYLIVRNGYVDLANHSHHARDNDFLDHSFGDASRYELVSA